MVSVFDNAKEQWEYPEVDYGYGNSFAELTHDCFEKHKQGRLVFTNGKEARRSLEIIVAAYESARPGKAIEVCQ